MFRPKSLFLFALLCSLGRLFWPIFLFYAYYTIAFLYKDTLQYRRFYFFYLVSLFFLPLSLCVLAFLILVLFLSTLVLSFFVPLPQNVGNIEDYLLFFLSAMN